ncbi:RHS repeat-associated core domain-containing protein [Streptomyces griseoincarnatus]
MLHQTCRESAGLGLLWGRRHDIRLRRGRQPGHDGRERQDHHVRLRRRRQLHRQRLDGQHHHLRRKQPADRRGPGRQELLLRQRRPGQPRLHVNRRNPYPHRHLRHQQCTASTGHQDRRQRRPDRRLPHRPQGLPQSITTSGGVSYLHQDPLGSVTDLTRADGTLQEQYTYDPFGIATATPADGVTAPDNPFGFSGQLNDQVLTGKQDLRTRTYDPATGRFTGRDPIDLRVTDPYVSAYVYAENAPTYLTDPSGEDPAPGNGWWVGGRGNYQHNFALQMAYEQEVAQHGVQNVYADLPGANVVWGEGR